MQSMKLNNSDIHLWYMDQADFDLAELRGNCLDWLTELELARYQRYQFDRHRKQLLLGRILIRSVLSQYDQSIEPASWRFSQNDYGKPAIHSEQQRLPLFFNLSHSDDKLVLAVASFENIGVDIEHCGKQRRIGKISGRYFSAREATELLAVPEQSRLQRFYELWTLKEAYIKACGEGLAISLQQFSYSFPSTEKLAIEFDPAREDDPGCWQLWQLDAGEKFKLALAARVEEGAEIQNLSSWQMTGLDEFQAGHSVIVRRS